MRILAIETSCDETGVAIIEFNKGSSNFTVIKDLLISQIDLHKEYGGVYPNIAKREHLKNLPILIQSAIGEEKNFKKIDAIAVTHGPGLSPALWTGIEIAKQISTEYNIPIYPINHMEGHIFASILKKEIVKDTFINEDKIKFHLNEIKYPTLSLLISGGHTEIIYSTEIFKYQKIGETLDDAVGEAFDKAARALGLDYPGGPEISKRAAIARRESKVIREELRLPRPMLHSGDLNFSFSGLKTSVINKIEKYKVNEDELNLFCMEFENAVTDVIVKKIREAIYLYNAKSLIVGGGVSANENIRNSLKKICDEDGVDIFMPEKNLSTDNALMIAAIAFAKHYYNIPPLDINLIDNIKAEPNLSLDSNRERKDTVRD